MVKNVLKYGASVLLLAACGDSRTEIDLPSGAAEQSIIGGFNADSSFWDHTGALVLVDEQFGERSHFCSATLIGPETVVTAKHCVDFMGELAELGVAFEWSGGSRVDDPLEVIPIVAVAQAPGEEGGFVGLGQDVGVVHLDFPSSLTPAVAAPFLEDLLGERMVTIGYGVFSARGAFDEQRRIGRETVVATEGRTFEALLGDFESFVEWAFTGQVTDDDILEEVDPDDPFLAILAAEFESTVILPGHEAVTGEAPADTQSCNGDSGGPLGSVSAAGVFSTTGVVSGGLNSLRQQCDFGTVFATFGPEVFAFLQAEQSWQDPCGDVPTAGSCDGTVRTLCDTSLADQRRELVVEDCADSGRLCVETDLGALCGTVPGIEPPAPPPEEAEEGTPPTEEQIDEALEELEDSFFPPLARSLPWRR